MCVPKEKRTLHGSIHDLIYDFFDKHDFCEKYIKDDGFCKYIRHMTEYRMILEKDKEKWAEFVEAVDWYVEVSEWRRDLRHLASVELMPILDANDVFSDIDAFEKGPVSYHQLCYHLGMIMFDYIDMKD